LPCRPGGYALDQPLKGGPNAFFPADVITDQPANPLRRSMIIALTGMLWAMVGQGGSSVAATRRTTIRNATA